MTSAERKALNEGSFRAANERLEKSAHEILGADSDSLVPFLCECPRESCMQVALLSLAEYASIRAEPRRGLALAGHEDPSIERVLDRNERFLVTEKFGRAGDVHEETDPRR